MAKRTEAHLSPISNNNGNVRVSTAGTKAAPGSKLISYSINWGDGTPNNNGIKPPIELIHTYAKSGNYTIILNVKDSKNRIAEDTMGMIVSINSGVPVPPDPPTPPSNDYNYYCEGGGYSGSGTVRMTNGSISDVQAKVDAAINGDIICIPPGSYIWDSNVIVWVDKDLYILGAGSSQVSISSTQQFAFFIHFTNQARGKVWIEGIRFTGDFTSDVITFSSTTLAAVPNGRWRINDVFFDFSTATTDHGAVHSKGVNFGVIYDSVFDWKEGGIAIRHSFGLDSEDNAGGPSTWSGNFANTIPTGFGGADFVFVEDNQFFSRRANFTDIYDADSGGGRIVWRYNAHVGSARFYNHWTQDAKAAGQVFEIYNNSWVIGTAPYSTFDPGHIARIEAGTFLFYNNYSNYNNNSPFIIIDDRRAGGFGGDNDPPMGACDGTHPWDGNAGDPSALGWPCLNQIGRGYNSNTSLANLAAGSVEQPSEPVYLWNNGIQSGCANGGSCIDSIAPFPDPGAYIKSTAHPNGEVDYILNGSVSKPGYAPYTYPHPIRNELWP